VYNLDDVFVNSLSNYKTINLSEQDIIIPQEYKTSETTSTEPSENSVENNNDSYLY
jgi:hypothetical protein